MNIAVRQKLLAAAALVVALWLGWLIAAGEHLLPGVIAGLALLGCLTQLAGVSLGTIALGAVLFGYMVGNRGFAQLMPVPGIPILPAELALLAAGAWVALQSALAKQLPFRRDMLNGMILLWLILGSARVALDVRPFGFMAVRDFAMVYYALFFFLAQHLAAEPGARRFLLGVLVLAGVVQPIAAIVSTAYPEFFFTTLSLRGVPLILFKGDLALTFTGVSALVLAFVVTGPLRPIALGVATLELLLVLGGDNRASVLGTVTALAWLALSRARRFVGAQVLAVAAAFLVLAALASLAESRWAERKFSGVTERVQSLADFLGTGTYASEESVMKGDNNRFRTLWWRTVIDETLAENPAFGLGFGHDLATSFLREYNPEIGDDFTARSPHSIVVSTIGRMGLAGLAVLLALVAVLAVRTWRMIRNPDTDPATLGLWAAVWLIFVSACFGVVLEGPMGAVVFWTLLGLANRPAPARRVPAIPSPAHPAIERQPATLAAG